VLYALVCSVPGVLSVLLACSYVFLGAPLAWCNSWPLPRGSCVYEADRCLWPQAPERPHRPLFLAWPNLPSDGRSHAKQPAASCFVAGRSCSNTRSLFLSSHWRFSSGNWLGGVSLLRPQVLSALRPRGSLPVEASACQPPASDLFLDLLPCPPSGRTRVRLKLAIGPAQSPGNPSSARNKLRQLSRERNFTHALPCLCASSTSPSKG
jgi:hypothetical protein